MNRKKSFIQVSLLLCVHSMQKMCEWAKRTIGLSALTHRHNERIELMVKPIMSP